MPTVTVTIDGMRYEVDYVATPPEPASTYTPGAPSDVEIVEIRPAGADFVLPQSLMEVFIDGYGPMVFQAITEDLESTKIEREIELHEGTSSWGYVRKGEAEDDSDE